MIEFPRIRPAEKDADDAVRARGPDAIREGIESKLNKSPLDWKKKFMVSKEKIEQMAETEMIVPGLIGSGQYHVVCAAANAGKTTIFMALAAEMVSKGYSVTYVNADISAAHAKDAARQAEAGGFDLLLPDLADNGVAMKDVVQCLTATAVTDVDLSGEVWIFDTVKKMTDMINKPMSKRLYETLRRLTAKGMTVIGLAHTNKYNDAEGKPIFEGTVDLRNDCDNLIYLVPKKNDDGSLTVSVLPDKQRAPLETMTFVIGADRSVTRTDSFVDVSAIMKAERQMEADQNVIEVIGDLLRQQAAILSRVIEHCADHKISKRSANAVLRRYTGQLWRCLPQYLDNAKLYEWIEKAHLLGNRETGKPENRDNRSNQNANRQTI